MNGNAFFAKVDGMMRNETGRVMPLQSDRTTLRIPPRLIGSISCQNFCQRCFWYRLHNPDMPYQVFPGIFSSIDSYTKRLVHAWFDAHGTAPSWLGALRGVVGYAPAPHWSQFTVTFDAYGITVAGTPDEMLLRADGTQIICDYKTAKYSAAQDELLPLYETQLNAYALIAGQLGYAPVSGLALIYMEPVCDCDDFCEHCLDAGFRMLFKARVVPVEINLLRLDLLLARARMIYDMRRPPEGRQGCKDCVRLERLLRVARR